MIIAHLPTGYIISRILARRHVGSPSFFRKFGMMGMLGATAPDIDMIYFYLIDHRQHPHHAYWTHFPVVWFSLLIAAIIWQRSTMNKVRGTLWVLFFFNACLHLILDTVVGDVRWLAPFVNKPFSFFIVPNLYKPWWLNFVLHWSFALELAILSIAAWMYFKLPEKPRC